jgi:two-component system cell cycle response regulator DivK
LDLKKQVVLMKELVAKSTFAWQDKVILIVEDDKSSLMLLQAILSKTGAKLIVAEDGESAVNIFHTNSKIDMVLMDIRLSGFDGLEATRRIRKINPDIPVIAQTACAILGDMEKCLAAGCNAYITKPIEANKLMQTMDYYFRRSIAQSLIDTIIFSN